MSDVTSIQWADTTVNPIMGCGGCELFPTPTEILGAIDRAAAEKGARISSRAIFSELVEADYGMIDRPLQGHKNVVNTTNIWHLRERFYRRVLDKTDVNIAAADAAEKAITHSITCYAAILHLSKGHNLYEENHKADPEYAPIFESVTEFPGRADVAANLNDLLGCSENRLPWNSNLPRLISVSDMGDVMSGTGHFPFLKSDLMPAIISDAGKRHLWLWLTKQPAQLANFAEEIRGLPENVCAMTSLTGTNEKNLQRLASLKKVKARIRGLSIEPLWEPIPLKNLDLKGIDWVIVGGESGKGTFTRPFALEWAEELRDHCRKRRVAFFMKQLGGNPTRNGEVLAFKDSHGGDWNEWPDDRLKIREFPKAFHNYRKREMKQSSKPPTSTKRKADIQEAPPSREEKAEFKRLHKIVNKGVKGFVEAGAALVKIHGGKLWKAGGFKTWDDYCRSVAGMSRPHAHRLIKASQCIIELREISDFSVWPDSESQVRPLLKLKNKDDRGFAWDAAVSMAEDTHSTAQPTAEDVRKMVVCLLQNELDDLEEKDIREKPPTRTQQRVELVSKLRTAIGERKSWDDVEKLLAELEKLI